MKKFVDDRNMKLLCPFCHCRVSPYRGYPPLNPCKTALIPTHSPASPLPLPAQLSFHLIPLTDDNFDFWKDYVYAMRLIAYNRDFSPALKYGWGQAVKGFLDALEAFEESPTSEVWIAAATFGPISKNDFAQSAVNIEMCMTVTTHPKVPFTTHMGIFRSPLRCLKISSLNALRHLNMYRANEIVFLLERDWSYLLSARNLSGQFHAFAAKRCLQDCSGVKKRYMITAPLGKMLEIMKKEYGSAATEKIRFEKNAKDEIVFVGNESFSLGKSALKTYIWLDKLVDLNGGRPKIAVDIIVLSQSMEERTRVEATLDWLDKWA
ncbi:MAG: hypothetical protein QOJ51_513 [Acidobacteriaceae bacterium]|nr:hypothetical protein [Acidobacteriaceae bacterium]